MPDALTDASYPIGDLGFKENQITSVEDDDGKYSIGIDGWNLYCGDDCPVVPVVGQTARRYGKGIGSRVRGLFINGTKIWYRTEAEDHEHFQCEMYGRDATEWLSRWDAGRGVWSITMGGFGPGYEQCIQITASEILRWLLKHTPDLSAYDTWKRVDAEVMSSHPVSGLGLSGAQWGAARNLASQLYRNGPRGLMTDDRGKERHIQVSRNFPDPEREALIEASRYLATEILGAWQAFEHALRADMGNTNYAVILGHARHLRSLVGSAS